MKRVLIVRTLAVGLSAVVLGSCCAHRPAACSTEALGQGGRHRRGVFTELEAASPELVQRLAHLYYVCATTSLLLMRDELRGGSSIDEAYETAKVGQKALLATQTEMMNLIKEDFDPAQDRLFYYVFEYEDGTEEHGWVVMRAGKERRRFPLAEDWTKRK